MNPKLIILGGGLSGLAAGEILSEHFQVTVLESAPFLGGLAATFEQDGKKIPMYYHHIIKSNLTTQEYLRKFGNISSLRWKKIKIGIGIEGKIHNINEPQGLMGFSHLTTWEKLRFGIFGAYTLFLMNPEKIPDDIDAESWLHKYAGKMVTAKIFYHLYSRNKFNLPLNRISAKQFANRLHEKEIYDYFAYPPSGYQCIIDGMSDNIIKNSGTVDINAKISRIDLIHKQITVNSKFLKYDILLSSIPLPAFLNITEGIPDDYKEQLSKVKYCPAVGICFGTEDFLERKNYWINLFNERIHTLFQHSLLNDTYADKINWCLRYGGSEEDLELSEEKIKDEYLAVVKSYFPQAKIKWAKVFRTKYAEPIYDIDYHKYMPDYTTPIEGLYFTGIQLTYPKIRNMNVALQSGIKAAEIIISRHVS